MKKYVKPMVALERYELSQTIADCAWEMSNATFETACMANPDPNHLAPFYSGPLFNTNKGCSYNIDDGFEFYCYQNGSASGISVFKS